MRLRTSTDPDPSSSPGNVKLQEGASQFLLRVQAVNASTYEFSYTSGITPQEWTTLGYGDVHQVSWGFAGTVIGMYATGNGRWSTTPAYFGNFIYEGVAGVI